MLPAMVLGQSKGYLGKRFIVNIENNIYLGRDSKGFTFGENKFLLGDHRSFKNRVLWGASFIASNKLLVYANYGNKSSLFAPPVFLSSVQNRVYYPTDATRAKEIRTSNTQVGLKFYGFGKTAFAPLGIYAGFAINYLTYDVDSLFFKSTTK